MSARGTMTSPTRRSRRPRMFLSIRLSSGVKPDSPSPMVSRTSCRSARAMFGFDPNSARIARMNQFSPPLRAGGTRTGRFRGSYDGAPAGLEPDGSLSDMASNVAKIVRTVGIGHFQTRHDLAFEPFH